MTRQAVKMATPQKNYLYNSRFDFWQRTNVTITNASTIPWFADRFWVASSLTSGHSISQLSSSLPSDNTYGLSLKATTTSSQTLSFKQPLEWDVLKELVGQTVTFSVQYSIPINPTNGWVFDVRGNSSTPNQKTPSGVNIVGDTTTGPMITNTSVTSWAYVTFTIPSNVQSMSVGVTTYLNQINNAEIKIFKVMLNIGVAPSVYNLAGDTYEQELSLCQRYYEKSYNLNTALATPTSVGARGGFYHTDNRFMFNLRYTVLKRSNPTVTFWGTSGTLGGVNQYNDTGANTRVLDSSTFSTGVTGISGDYKTYSSGPAFVASIMYLYHWVADAELT